MRTPGVLPSSGSADTCVGLAFGYVDEIVQYIKDNSVLNPDDGVAFEKF